MFQLQDAKSMIPTAKIVASRCNLRCKYCYYHGQHKRQNEIMSEGVLRELISKTLKFSELNPVQIVWHGGEPMLAGIEFFETVLSLEAELSQGRKFENHIQTNATLVSDQWADFFARNQFVVGISLDGPESIHNSYRVYKNGRGSFADVMRGLNRLHEVGLNPGAIALITKASLRHAKEMLNFFVSAGVKRFLPKPCYEVSSDGEPTEFSISSHEFSEFMLEILDAWLEKDNPLISIRNLEQMMVGVAGGNPSLCEFSGKCWLCPKIEYDGSVGPCDSMSSHNYHFGNIVENTWDEIFQGKEFLRFLSELKASESPCQDCEWLKNCHNRCTRYCSSGGLNVFCDAKKAIFLTLLGIVEAV